MKFYLAIILLFVIQYSNAQDTYILNNELGVYVGKTSLQTDFGESKKNSNAAMNIGLAYIADFSKSRFKSKLFNFIKNHSKTRIELSYAKIELDYYNYSTTSGESPNFKAIQGESKQFNIGSFGEFYFLSLEKETKFQPYFLTGISYSSIKPSITSTLPFPSLFTPINENIFTKKQNILSFSYGLGSRYTFNKIDVLLEARFNPFLSDKVEGLDTNNSGDKSNDTQFVINFGFVYKFNVSKKQ